MHTETETETAACLIATLIGTVTNRWSSFLCIHTLDMGLNKVEYMTSGSNISAHIIKPTTVVGFGILCVEGGSYYPL